MRSTLIRIRNFILRILFLLLVLVVSIIIFENMINKALPESAVTMENSTFPTICMERGNVSFNRLYGYADEMDVTRMRDTITPLQSDRSIGIRIQTYSVKVDSVSYEVLPLDGSPALENTKVIHINQESDELTATITLQNKMLMNQEYALKIQLTTGGRNIYYYTRVILADALHTDDYLNFVSGFYDKTVNRTDLGTVGAAVEPDDTTDEDATLARMDIHDSVDTLTWGNLFPTIYYKPTPRICEINSKTASLTMEYRIAATGENGVTEIYNVNEFYRVRFTDSRVFLLNFERSTDEVFNPDNNVITEKGIRLGITGKDVNFKTDENNRIIAFVQQNELWSYERSSGKLTQIFSFPQKENMDLRDFHNGCDFRIMKVAANGDVWFVIAGRMNRGEHEGENGVSLCYYDSATAMTEEKLFVQTVVDREMLRRDVDALTYVTDDGAYFYLQLEQQLVRIRIADHQIKVMAENIIEGGSASSESGRYYAWISGDDPTKAQEMYFADLETGNIETIEAAAKAKIKPVCFMNEDLVYGQAWDEDLARASLSSGYFPMYQLVIRSGEGEILKEYTPRGCRVTKAVLSDHLLRLTRVRLNAAKTGLEAYTDDEIVDTNTSSSVAVGIATSASSRKLNEVFLRTGGTISDTSAALVYSKIIRPSSSRSVRVEPAGDVKPLYTVYAHGGLYDIFYRANEAVDCADKNVGVALLSSRDYLWVRGMVPVTAQIALDKVPEVLKAGVTDISQITQAGQIGLDLSGCTLEQVLNFVGSGRPVAAITEKGPVTIVGFDEFNTHLLDPGGEEWYYYGINDSTEMFEKQGNQFFACG